MTRRRKVDPRSCLRFFLGGRDLEMLEVRKLLERYAHDRFIDKGLTWGAKLSAYRKEIEASARAGEIPVAVELTDDMPKDWFPRAHLIAIDHHGELAAAGMPSALEQVFGQLALPKKAWTRRLRLVAANDVAHVRGLRAAGARAGEIVAIRQEDRRAQGVTEEDEREAIRAIAERRRDGRLLIVETRSATASAVGDLMLPELGGPGYEDLLVIMPAKLVFFGNGATVKALQRKVPGSWSGGALPERGYWGVDVAAEVSRRQVIEYVQGIARRRR